MMKNNNTNIIQNRPFGCKIIPFPGVDLYENYGTSGTYYNTLLQNVISGRPGEKLPASIPDFRPYLQRNGLILLSWNKRLTKKGGIYTAYWVTSSGVHRYYASPALFIEDFQEALPYRKSYAAEDGIDYYGETSPLYIVHVAPELMMSSSEKKLRRPEHISKLKNLGIQVDFDYNFLLTREKKRRPEDSLRGA